MQNTNESQSQAILSHLKAGNAITPIDALNQFGCFRLGARIHELKSSGHRINTEMISNNGKRFARYSLHSCPQ
jgi:hypothetical protein